MEYFCIVSLLGFDDGAGIYILFCPNVQVCVVLRVTNAGYESWGFADVCRICQARSPDDD